MPNVGVFELVEISTQEDSCDWVLMADVIDTPSDVVLHWSVVTTRRVVDQFDGDVTDLPRQALHCDCYPYSCQIPVI